MAEPNKNSTSKNRPRLRTLEQTEGERHASWLELFFDLVFVLAVAQIAKMLAGHTDFSGIVKYVALFVPVWWTWMGFTFYADRFESEETAYRILTFAAMLGVAALALCLPNVFLDGGDTPFVICYVLVRLILITLYARAAYHVPLSRPYNLQFIAGFSIAVGLWLISIFVPPPLRYGIWTLAVIIELITPFINVRKTISLPFDPAHIPERFGLFTIIVLGEAVVATANGAAQTVWNVQTISAASIGFAMAAAVWWINFEFVEDSPLKSDRALPRFIFLYGHFFIVAGIVALGIGVEHAIQETGAGENHLHLATLALLGGSIAVYLATITAIKLAADSCNLMYARLASTIIALAFIFVGQFVHPLVSLSVFFFLLGFGVWLESRFGELAESTDNQSQLCQHADQMRILEPPGEIVCEECVKNNYKWVHLRLCAVCGHIGCCDSSEYKHATKHFKETEHPIISSLEPAENWAWCYIDDRFVPLVQKTENKNRKGIKL